MSDERDDSPRDDDDPTADANEVMDEPTPEEATVGEVGADAAADAKEVGRRPRGTVFGAILGGIVGRLQEAIVETNGLIANEGLLGALVARARDMQARVEKRDDTGDTPAKAADAPEEDEAGRPQEQEATAEEAIPEATSPPEPDSTDTAPTPDEEHSDTDDTAEAPLDDEGEGQVIDLALERLKRRGTQATVELGAIFKEHFEAYVRDHLPADAKDDDGGDRTVVIDGEFVREHGASMVPELLAGVMGDIFAGLFTGQPVIGPRKASSSEPDDGDSPETAPLAEGGGDDIQTPADEGDASEPVAAGSEQPEAANDDQSTSEVRMKVDLMSVLGALFRTPPVKTVDIVRDDDAEKAEPDGDEEN